MPKAIIAMVRTALTLFDLIALNATLIFSVNSVIQFNSLPPVYIKELRYSFFYFCLLQGKNDTPVDIF